MGTFPFRCIKSCSPFSYCCVAFCYMHATYFIYQPPTDGHMGHNFHISNNIAVKSLCNFTVMHKYLLAQVSPLCWSLSKLLEPFTFSTSPFYFLRSSGAHEEYRVESPTSQCSPLYSRGRAVPLSSLALPPALDTLLSPHPHPPDQETLHQGWIQMLLLYSHHPFSPIGGVAFHL